MSIMSDFSSQTRSYAPAAYIRSRSASELLLRKRPSFLASRRFAQERFNCEVSLEQQARHDAPINAQYSIPLAKQKPVSIVSRLDICLDMGY
jgi:hypothetical protein